MAKKKESLTEAVASELKKNFNLDKFKTVKGLNQNVHFKEQKWIPFSPAVKEAIKIPGFPMGHLILTRGRSDTGKTTLMIESAIAAQKMGILPVFIITEMKWDFEHAATMGFELERIPNPDNPNHIEYGGFFLYADRSSLNSIEDVAAFILDLFDEQKKGNLPYDLLFLWDSVGSIPCQLSIDAKNNNAQWNAGAMAIQFGNFVNQKFAMTRKTDYPYTNTMLAINKVGVQSPESPMGRPKMTNKTGDTMYWDASLVITFGNVTNSGTSKLKAIKNKRNVEFAKITKIAVDKIHTGIGVTCASTVVVTPHGFIENADNSIAKYKKQYSNTWFEEGGGDDIEIVEDRSEWEEDSKVGLAEIFDNLNND
jgi:hypothetical protein